MVRTGKAYQVFLSHGILFGIGCALAYIPSSNTIASQLDHVVIIPNRLTPTMAVIGHWFKRNRAYAFGVAVSGSSMGGLCFPIVLKHLFPLVGFRWTVRILALIAFCCLMISCLTIRTRIPLRGTISLTDAVDFGGFRDKDYVLAGIAAFLCV